MYKASYLETGTWMWYLGKESKYNGVKSSSVWVCWLKNDYCIYPVIPMCRFSLELCGLHGKTLFRWFSAILKVLTSQFLTIFTPLVRSKLRKHLLIFFSNCLVWWYYWLKLSISLKQATFTICHTAFRKKTDGHNYSYPKKRVREATFKVSLETLNIYS